MVANGEAYLSREIPPSQEGYPASVFDLAQFEGSGDYPNFLTVYFASAACAWIRHRGPAQLEVKISGSLDWVPLDLDKKVQGIFLGRSLDIWIEDGLLKVHYSDGPLRGVFQENRLARPKSASQVASTGTHAFTQSQWIEPALVLAHGVPDLMMSRHEVARVYAPSIVDSALYYFVLGSHTCRILYEGDSLELGGHDYYSPFVLEVREGQLCVEVPPSSFAQFAPLVASQEELRLEKLHFKIGNVASIERDPAIIRQIFHIQEALQKCFSPFSLKLFERLGLQRALASARKIPPEEIGTLAV